MSASVRERGVALILVLVVLPLVAIVMTQLHFEVTVGGRLARNTLANQQFKQAIAARIRQMRQLLERDLKEDEKSAQQAGAYDHYGDLWGPESEGGRLAAVVRKGDQKAGDEITLYTEVEDEQSKFNINLLRHRDPARRALAFKRFRRLLDLFRDWRYRDLENHAWDLDDVQAGEVAEAVRKFLEGEARDERLPRPQVPPPSPEMQQGVYTVDDLAFAHPLFQEKRLLEAFDDVESGQRIPSLARFLTVHGDGRINCNTAPIQLLRALFEEPDAQAKVAEAILRGRGGYLETEEDRERREEDEKRRREEKEDRIRRGEEEPLENANAYKSLADLNKVEGFSDQGMLRRNEIDPARDFTVRTNFFQVTVTARRENLLRQHRVVLERHLAGTILRETEVRAADLAELPPEEEEAPAGAP
jgi:type II secretory pathway component PulK